MKEGEERIKALGHEKAMLEAEMRSRSASLPSG